MAKISSIATDASLETQGAWVSYLEDVELLVARSSNPEMVAWSRRALRPYKGRLKSIKEPEMRKITLEGWARYVLKGWRNLQDEQGEEIPYSPEKAMEILARPELKDLFDFVIRTSQTQSTFVAAALEADLGN